MKMFFVKGSAYDVYYCRIERNQWGVLIPSTY